MVADALRLNGTLGCFFVRADVDRETLLATAGFPAVPTIEVYVPGLPNPLQDRQRIQLSTGDCVSFVPFSGSVFVVTNLASGWQANPELPCLPGYWVHLLTEDGQQRILIEPQRRRFLRVELARHLDLVDVDFVLQAVPTLDDSFDFGILANIVVIVATRGESEPGDATPGGSEDTDVLYCLDLRPITCGLTWGRARDGLVSSRALTSRCEPHCPAGYSVVIVGGIPVRGADGFDLQVQPGSVLAVEFAALPNMPEMPLFSAGPASASDSDSSSSDSDSSSGSDGVAPPGRGSRVTNAGHARDSPGDHSDSANVDACEVTSTVASCSSPAATLRICQPRCGIGAAATWLWLSLVAACSDVGTAVQLPPAPVGECLWCPGAVTTGTGSLGVADPTDAEQHLRTCDYASIGGAAAGSVPTPCRAPGPVLDADMRWHLEVLDTLLDECASTSDLWAFLASTLIETLQEHLLDTANETAVGVNCTGSFHGTCGGVLSLDRYLSSARNYDISGVNLRLGCSLDEVLPHFRPGQWPLRRSFPEGLDLHPAAEVFRHLSADPRLG